MRYFCLMLFISLVAGCNLNADEPLANPQTTTLAVYLSWVQQGDLWVYGPDDSNPRRVASGGVVRPYLAPDGQTIAFTRGPEGTPQTLWAVDFTGGRERELAGTDDLLDDEGIGQVGWWDENALYFNTFQVDNTHYVPHPRHNLYRVHAVTGELALIRAPAEGGNFSFDPQREHIILVYPGTYNVRDGRISMIDPLVLEPPRNLLFFEGVATGAETLFYPEIYWEASGEAVRFAIPDPDLLYASGDNIPTTALWRVPLDAPSNREVIGSLQADFFGLPVWSPDGAHLVYLKRTATSPNRLELYLAEGDGSNAILYNDGQVGNLNRPRWIDERQFVYIQGEPGAYWLGSVDAPPQRLTEKTIFNVRWLSSGHYIYLTPEDGSATIELGALDGVAQPIITIEGAQADTLRYSAVMVDD